MGEDFPIIASGGVMTAQHYENKIKSGATLVQIYTGFIYSGPKLIQDIINSSIN
jgi:dihydroorotate dehydrogenase